MSGLWARPRLLGRLLMRPNGFRAVIAATASLALVLSACSTPSASENHGSGTPYGANDGADPVSLSELAVLGGATYEGLSPEQLADRTELAIEAVVIDVRPSHLNTSDGLFPSAEDILTNGLSELVVLTDITIKIVKTLGSSSEAPTLNEGDLFTITVGGGTIFTTLSVEQANALGATEISQDFPEHTEGDGLPPDVEIEEPVNSPIEFVWGTAPDEDLTEGDTVAVFLTRVIVTGYESAAGEVTMWGPVHPYGVFQRGGQQEWIPAGPEFDGVSPEDLAKLIRP